MRALVSNRRLERRIDGLNAENNQLGTNNKTIARERDDYRHRHELDIAEISELRDENEKLKRGGNSE